ncbi:TPA: hypothetical protein ACGPMY_001720 [Yersinia enterocolitica]
MTTITDETTWEALCEDSQQRQDLKADWVRENGELIIGGDWITEAEQLGITAVPGFIRLQLWEDEVSRLRSKDPGHVTGVRHIDIYKDLDLYINPDFYISQVYIPCVP